MSPAKSPAEDVVVERVGTSSAVARVVPVRDYFYTQLAPGRFEIAISRRQLDDVVLTRTAIEPLSVGVVVPDPAWLALVVPFRWRGEYRFNGALVTPTSLGISGDGNGYLTRGEKREGIVIGLRLSRFAPALAALRGIPVEEVRFPTGLLPLPTATMAHLRNRLSAMLDPAASPDALAASTVTGEDVYQLFLDACLDAKLPDPQDAVRVVRHAEIVRKAEERFAASAGRPVSLADLCAAAGVGRTKLQQAFQSLCGESPLAYFRKRRLMQAREALVSASPERFAVKRAALDAGLHALGRFSVEYRLLFGERPSASLRQAPI